jgi:hypothetical protein
MVMGTKEIPNTKTNWTTDRRSQNQLQLRQVSFQMNASGNFQEDH